MTKVFSKALEKSIEIERIIGQIKGEEGGPSIVFTGGIHGNEPSGVFALYEVIRDLKDRGVAVKGNLYAVAGNLWALERGERFHKEDLNRVWSKERVEEIRQGKTEGENEDVQQQIEIFQVIDKVITEDEGPFYFMDLHTTSGKTKPFLTVNDSLLNRKFTMQYPVPMILGIEEYLGGPLLSYINELGYVAFGYEGGQHDEVAAIENHKAFIYLSLVFSGMVNKKDVDFDFHFNNLSKGSGDSIHVYEIFYRYQIQKGEVFKMKPGYENFQDVPKDKVIAESNGEPVVSIYRAQIFMPLYQSQGDDGFFAIRKIRPIFLKLSTLFRIARVDRILPLLPGVRWYSKEHKDTLLVNRNIAKFFAKKFIHLMGYRSKKLDETHLIIRNREAASRDDAYRDEPWI